MHPSDANTIGQWNDSVLEHFEASASCTLQIIEDDHNILHEHDAALFLFITFKIFRNFVLCPNDCAPFLAYHINIQSFALSIQHVSATYDHLQVGLLYYLFSC